MSRKPVEINPESGKRLSAWLHDIKMPQSVLAGKIHYTQQFISNITTGKKRLTLEFANAVSEKTALNEFDRIRPEYLLCLDGIRTERDRADLLINRMDSEAEAMTVLFKRGFRSSGYQLESDVSPTIQSDDVPICGTVFAALDHDHNTLYFSDDEIRFLKKNAADFIDFIISRAIKEKLQILDRT